MVGTLVHSHQRRAVRRAVRVPCLVMRQRDYRLVGSYGLDLSPTGMLVKAHERVLTGEPVQVSFRLPKSRAWIAASATIARVLHGRRPGDTGRCLGIEFDSLDPAVLRRLRSDLHNLPPPLPNREPRIDYAASVHLAALA
jgi:hypothetical protein